MTFFIASILSFIFAFNLQSFYISGDVLSLKDCQNTYPKSELSLYVYSLNPEFELLDNQADIVRPIASITKLMTALVFLDTEPNWEDEYTIIREDKINGGRLNLFLGDTLTIDQLFKTALIASDNGATVALVRSTGLSEEGFVFKMNEKAREIGLLNTKFADTTGLSNDNVSTARELATLASLAFSQDEILQALENSKYTYITRQEREKIIVSTLDLLTYQLGDLNYLAGKTGYTPQAGYCLVSLFSQNNKDIITVVLGAQERLDRVDISLDLAQWRYSACPL
jgi:serine-type D-Ala-D-Ala endopeptidase (penicillin-binding protein 7)